MRSKQNGGHFPGNIFKCIFFNENVCISIKISLSSLPKGSVNNIPVLVQIMAWHQSDDKSLSESMLVSLLMHICVTRSQWVNMMVLMWLCVFVMILTHWGRDKMVTISQTTLSNPFSWMKMFEFRLKFHWSWFPRVQLTIFQHWFR